MTQRNCGRTVRDVSQANKRITLPVDLAGYQKLVADPKAFRAWVDTNIVLHPELFPVAGALPVDRHHRMFPARFLEYPQTPGSLS